MRFTRVSIGQLMVLVVLIAFASVALIRPTRVGASMVFAATFVALTVATVAAKFGRAESRVSCAGFAIGGWLCMVVHFSPLNTSPSGLEPWRNGPLLNPPTTALLDFLYPRLVDAAYRPVPAPSISAPVGTFVVPQYSNSLTSLKVAPAPTGIPGPTPKQAIPRRRAASRDHLASDSGAAFASERRATAAARCLECLLD